MLNPLNTLDAATLLAVVAVFHALFAVVWLVLAQVWHMAPPASRAMAASQGVCMLSAFLTAAPWPAAPRWHALCADGATLLGVGLMVLAVQRATHQHRAGRLAAAVGAIGMLGVGLAAACGRTDLGLAVTWAAIALQAGLGLWGVRRWMRSVEPVWITAPLVAALVSFALLGAWRALARGLEPSWDGVFMQGRHPTPLLAVVWWVAMALAGLSLLNLLVWRLVTRARHLLRRDGLTGALNRRAFHAELVEAQAHMRRGRGFALVVMDLDHFKRVNDSWGHAAGDAALRHCVRVWRECLRDLDQLGRLGGEEFGVILWGADLAMALAVAERMRERLQETPLSWAGESVRVTASFGVALPLPHDSQGESGLARADAQLYRAKAQGRNQVCAASEGA